MVSDPDISSAETPKDFGIDAAAQAQRWISEINLAEKDHAGVTSDDFACFMTDQGQVAIYQGIDPTNASAWSLVGVYDFGPPLSPKALIKFGGDLAVLTADGVIPMSAGLRLDRSEQQAQSLTSNIMNAFSDAVRQYAGNFGWQGLLYPGSGSLAIFNVPTATLKSAVQYVQNVLTGAWCRFAGINAFAWETANGLIFFGGVNAAGTNGVFQWDVGSDDDGAPIVATVQQAFSAFGEPGRQKLFTMIRPLLNTNALVQPALDILTDYKTGAPTAVATVVDASQTGQQIRYDWTGVGATGFVGAPIMQINLAGDQTTLIGAEAAGPDWVGSGDGYDMAITPPYEVPCQLIGFDLVYEPGGLL
jgi:hypothetical protein